MPLCIYDRLIEQGQGVSETPRTAACDDLYSLFVKSYLFKVENVLKVLLYHLLRDLLEAEMLGARKNGCRQLERICSGKNELDKIGRLFERFEQGIECLVGQHVYFIDDEDLVACGAGFVLGMLDEIFDVVDTAVGGSIHLDDIHMAVLCRHDAVGAFAAGMGTFSLLTQQGFGKDTCGRGFTAPTQS